MNATAYIPVEMAAKLADIPWTTVYWAIKRGRIPVRVVMVQRFRVRLKDVRAYKAAQNPMHKERGRKGMARMKELRAQRLTAAKIAMPTRRLVNHPGPKRKDAPQSIIPPAPLTPSTMLSRA